MAGTKRAHRCGIFPKSSPRPFEDAGIGDARMEAGGRRARVSSAVENLILD